MEDMRELGKSYGFFIIPRGGKNVEGLKFKEGAVAVERPGWYKILLTEGCDEISQAEYEDLLQESQSSRKEVADAEPDNAGGNQSPSGRTRGGRKPRARRDAGRVPSGS